MKANFLWILSCLFCSMAQAQSFTGLVFTAEGKDYYQVSGAFPQSAIAFYSSQGGGEVLLTQPVDETGKALLEGNKNFAPAFMLNTANAATGQEGSNKVWHFKDRKEFVLEQIKLEKQEDKVFLQWEAAVSSLAAYEFKVLKSKNGIDFREAATLQPQSMAMSLYQYTDEPEGETAYYQIQVTGKKNDINYHSKKLLMSQEHKLLVYPTVFTDYITVALMNFPEEQAYQILDIHGKVVQKGILEKSENKLNLQHLSAGTYLIGTRIGSESITQKIVKR